MRTFAIASLAFLLGTSLVSDAAAQVCDFNKAGEQTCDLGSPSRQSRITIPPVSCGSGPFPLVIYLHGAPGGIYEGDNNGWPAQAAGSCFVEVNAHGSILTSGVESWHVYNDDLGYTGTPPDDVAYLKSVVAAVRAGLPIDGQSIGAAGFSAGGFMASRLAIDAGDVFNAVVAVAATQHYENTGRDPAIPAHPVADTNILELNGSADNTIPACGTPGPPVNVASADETLNWWSGNGYTIHASSGSVCNGKALVLASQTLTNPSNGLIYQWTSLAGVGHSWDNQTANAWAFINGHRRNGAPPIAVAISPSNATVISGGTQLFTATVTGSTNTAVAWSATKGSVNASGLYTAPATTFTITATVTARSVADPSKSAAATVTVNPAAPPPPGGGDNRYCGPGNVPMFGPADGPALMPAACFYTALSATPSPGAQTHVQKGASLQQALNAAACGDTLLLDPAGDWPMVTLPRKNCSNSQWITVRADVSDALLPAEGTRITPCYAGISSLPGRPAYSCPNPARVIPSITLVGQNDAVVASGDHYRLLGLEIRQSTASALVYLGIDTRGGDHLVVDRCWIHGTATSEFNHGIWMNSSNYVAIIDSYLNDFHCKSPGVCSDSQAIGGGTSNTPDGQYKFVNNFLESSGEGFLFGGSSASTTPHDIEIRRNHFFKPMIWNPSDPSYFGTKFTTKNHFECKNCDSVLFEGNILENVWGGFSQVGAAILMTPKNQGQAPGQCPSCYVRNVTIRYNQVINAAQIFQVANAADAGGLPASGGYNYSIHDVLATGLSYSTCYQCGNYESQLSTLLNAPTSFILHDVTIDHITMVPDQANPGWAGGFNTLGGTAMQNITWTNSIFDAGIYGPWSTGQGTGDCASAPNATSPLGKFDSCFIPYAFAGNVIARGMSIQQSKSWPTGNFFPTDMSQVGFVNLSGDYHLTATSPYKKTGTDGKDPGADIDCMNTVIAGGDISSCGNPPPPPVTVSISPPSATLASGATLQFTATVTGSTNTAVTWSATKGSVNASGLYTAPATTFTITATVTARSVADPTKSAAASVTVNPAADIQPPTVSIAPQSPTVLSGASLQFTATVTGSTNTAVAWSVTNNSGSISPSGLFSAPVTTFTVWNTVVAKSVADPTKSTSTVVKVSPPADVTPPTATWASPADGSKVSGVAAVRTYANDNLKVAYVQFQIDGVNVGGQVLADPYSYNWDTTKAKEGAHVVTAIAVDASGNSAAVSVTLTVVRTLNPKADVPGLRSSFAYPNPAVRGQTPIIRASLGLVDSIEITIFDASGRVVNDASLVGAPTGVNTDGDYYYDYAWSGAIASGIYHYVLHGKKADGTIVRARGALAVVR